MNEGLCLKANPGHLKPHRRLKQSDQLRCRAHLGFFLLLIACVFRLQGKVFPKLRKRIPQGSGSTDSVSDKEEDEATDYVFRILFPNSQSAFGENSSRQSNKT